MNSIGTLENLFPGFWRMVLGSGKDFPLERKVLNAALFAAVIVTASILVSTIVFPISGSGKYIALFGSVLFGSFYLVGRRKQESRWLAWFFLFVVYAIILLAWRFSSGIGGVAPFAIIAFTGVIPLILPPNGQIMGFLSVAAVAATIYVLSLTSIETIPHFELTSANIHNVMISVIAISAGLGLVGLLVINTHRHSRTKILRLYASLQEMNETVEERNTKLEIALNENKALNNSLQDMNDRIEERNTTLEIILNKNKVLNKSLIEMNERVEERNAKLENALKENVVLNNSLKEMNETVEERNTKLEIALSEIKTLKGIVPICAFCKKIRNDKGYYESVEEYVAKHTHAEFSHGYCPDCARKNFPELYEDEPEA
jgi:predicted  nucleic acid-binding Zn-ribbon protein